MSDGWIKLYVSSKVISKAYLKEYKSIAVSSVEKLKRDKLLIILESIE